MALSSIVQERGHVTFPTFHGERVYMLPFRKADGLPPHLSRWQPTVDAMLEGVDVAGPIYLMIDQSNVAPGAAHRRPGVHIDGYWVPALSAHDATGGHGSGPPAQGGHSSSCRHGSVPTSGGHGSHGSHGGSRSMSGGTWHPGATYDQAEGIILASDVQGCRAYAGSFNGVPASGGDCAHVDLSGLEVVDCRPHRVYAGNVTMLHESLPIESGALRSLVRLNVPGWMS